MSAPELRTFVIPQDLAGTRLDVALARLSPDLTRSRVQRLVAGGNVRLAGRPAKASARLRGGEPVEVRLEPPEPTGALPQELPLARDRTRFTGKLRSSPRRALTEWRVVERFGADATLAEVTLHTGRTHQIRVHLAEAGHPLLADAVYGGTRREGRAPDGVAARAAAAIGRQALHAARLAFDHPRTGRRVSFEAPLPEDFRRALAVLRRG